MALRDVFKISFKTFFNPLGWLDYENLKNKTLLIYNLIHDYYTIPVTATHKETFDQAMERLKLTKKAINQMHTQYRLIALFFAIIGFVLFGYAFYILFRYHFITGWLLGIAASCFSFSIAFKYDFWALQIKRRTLGLTLKDWKSHYLTDKGPSL